MINYLWLGLVVIAIAIGGFKEIAKYPLRETPKPVMISVDEESAYPDGQETDSGDQVLFSHDLNFSDSDRVSIPASISMSEEKMLAELKYQVGKDDFTTQTVTGISFPVSTGGSDLNLEYVFSDNDGEVFIASGESISAVDEVTESNLALESIIPSPQNPLGTLDYPFTLTSVVLLNNGEGSTGEFQIGIPSYTFAEVAYTGSEGESWMAVLTESIPSYAKISINLAIGLIGIMMFWLGLMRIAEAAGMVKLLARALKPIMVLLFPKIDPDSDAMGAILMNMAANMLGLGNAATPLGIKAMNELQKQNPYKHHASNAQAMLLALNTSSVTLLPATIIAYRASAGSSNLMAFWPVMIMSTLCATIAAVIACKLLEKLPMFAIPADAEKNDEFIGNEEA